MTNNNNEYNWQAQRICLDVGDYELSVEKQKTSWNCEQRRESWKWIVAYHGSIVSSGSANSDEEAKDLAISNLPENKKEE